MFDYTFFEYLYLTIGTLKGLWYQSFGIAFYNPFYFYTGVSLVLLSALRTYRAVMRCFYYYKTKNTGVGF